MTETSSAIIQSTTSARSPGERTDARYSVAPGAMSMMDSATMVPWSLWSQLDRSVGLSVSVV